jgi:hypothetical protein
MHECDVQIDIGTVTALGIDSPILYIAELEYTPTDPP